MKKNTDQLLISNHIEINVDTDGIYHLPVVKEILGPLYFICDISKKTSQQNVITKVTLSGEVKN